MEAYSGWSIRDAAYKESANSYLAEKIYENILNDIPSSLHAKGIYLGEFEIEGNTYNTAVFSYKNEVNIKKIHTNELCELANSEKLKVAIKDGYTLITFFDDSKNLEMVLQINGDELKTAKTWLTYLGIFTEKTTQEEIEEEYNRIVEFWANLFGGDDSIDAETLEKIEEASDDALDAGESWNPTKYACNNTIRAYLYYFKNDPVLFPEPMEEGHRYGSGLSGPNDETVLIGEVTYDGTANLIYDDLVAGDMDDYFSEIEKGNNETWNQFFNNLQKEANSGEIIIGVIKESGHGHIVAVMPKSLFTETTEKIKIGNDNNVELPITLEAGGDIKEIKQFPKDRKDELTRETNPYKWYKYIK